MSITSSLVRILNRLKIFKAGFVCNLALCLPRMLSIFARETRFFASESHSMPAMIEETEESRQEHILRALEEVSSQSCEKVFNSFVRINWLFVVQELSVNKGIMRRSILQ